MKLSNKVASLERAFHASGACSVRYKVGRGPSGEVTVPIEKALEDARKGRIKAMSFPLTFNEEQAERASEGDILAEIGEIMDGIRRDTNKCRGFSDVFVLCSRPIIYAHQAPPKGWCGGYFVTEDGEEFHQTEWKEILAKHGAGFIIVKDYDESKEPWHAATKEAAWKGIK